MITMDSTGAFVLDLSRAGSIMDWVALSLATRKGSNFMRPWFGSEFHLLRRSKALDALPARALNTAKACLQWLLNIGWIDSVDGRCTFATIADGNRVLQLNLVIVIQSTPVAFSYWIPIPQEPQ